MTTAATASLAVPVSQTERIGIMDALRGFAILGILLMNIPGFGLPSAVGYDPSVLNEFGTINYWIYRWVVLFPEGTQRAIFSMLFGAGIILFTSRAEKKLAGVLPAEYFLRRQLWLLVFGLLDAWLLLWYGDILFDYACLGIIMYVFRKLPPKKLLIGAGVCFLLMMARENRDLYQEKAVISKGEWVAAIDTTKTKLTEQQKEQLTAMTDMKERSTHEKKVKRMEKSIRKTTGSYAEVYEFRTAILEGMLLRFVYFGVWDVLAFMFVGMAFFKTGVLLGQASAKVYGIMTIVGLGVGLWISYVRMQPTVKYNFNWFEYTKHTWFELYTLSRLFRSFGILGFLLLLYKSGWFKWLFALMRAPGQMAFTNYLTQSLICGIFFYGVGFGMYGKLQRVEVYCFVLAVWAVQIIWSHLWLRYFSFGPLEWLWRSLTYWKKQPMRKNKSAGLATA